MSVMRRLILLSYLSVHYKATGYFIKTGNRRKPVSTYRHTQIWQAAPLISNFICSKCKYEKLQFYVGYVWDCFGWGKWFFWSLVAQQPHSDDMAANVWTEQKMKTMNYLQLLVTYALFFSSLFLYLYFFDSGCGGRDTRCRSASMTTWTSTAHTITPPSEGR